MLADFDMVFTYLSGFVDLFDIFFLELEGFWQLFFLDG